MTGYVLAAFQGARVRWVFIGAQPQEVPWANGAKVMATFVGFRVVAVRARLATATHRDLAQEAASGRFRLDLYERLACRVVRSRRFGNAPKTYPLRRGRIAPLP